MAVRPSPQEHRQRCELVNVVIFPPFQREIPGPPGYSLQLDVSLLLGLLKGLL